MAVAGTFLTLDICASRLAAEGRVDVRGAVERVRAQRAHSIQMPDQYVFCHLAIIEYAVSTTTLVCKIETINITCSQHVARTFGLILRQNKIIHHFNLNLSKI